MDALWSDRLVNEFSPFPPNPVVSLLVSTRRSACSVMQQLLTAPQKRLIRKRNDNESKWPAISRRLRTYYYTLQI